MTYSKSRAIREFENEIDLIKTTLATAFSTPGIPYPVGEYAVASAIFLTSAKIESYIQDSLDSVMQAISISGKRSRHLPDRLRSFLFAYDDGLQQAWKNFVANGSERLLVEAVTSLRQRDVHKLTNDQEKFPPIPGSSIYGRKKYPSPDNLETVYGRLGIEGVFSKTSARMRRNSRALIESFNSKRTALAHSGTLPGVSHTDVIREIGEIRDFVFSLDQEVYAQFRTSFSHRLWNTYVQ